MWRSGGSSEELRIGTARFQIITWTEKGTGGLRSTGREGSERFKIRKTRRVREVQNQEDEKGQRGSESGSLSTPQQQQMVMPGPDV